MAGANQGSKQYIGGTPKGDPREQQYTLFIEIRDPPCCDQRSHSPVISGIPEGPEILDRHTHFLIGLVTGFSLD